MQQILYDTLFSGSLVGTLASGIREQLPFLPALVVVGVGIAAIVAVALSHRPWVRPAFIALFFSGLLVVNLVGIPIVPFMHWQKFSEVHPTERTFYDYRVVTATGDEITFEERAVTNVDGAYMLLVTDEMRSANESRRAELSAYMLERARIHRERVETRSPLHYLRFPPHSIGEWTAAELEGHAEFVGLRTYERTAVVNEDGTRVVSDTETLVFEYMDPTLTSNAVEPSAVSAGDRPQPVSLMASVPSVVNVHPETLGGVR